MISDEVRQMIPIASTKWNSEERRTRPRGKKSEGAVKRGNKTLNRVRIHEATPQPINIREIFLYRSI